MDKTPLEQWIAEKIGGPLTATALRNYQMEKLRETLSLVLSKSRFYQKQFARINPAAIKSPADFSALPFTFPEHLSARPEDFLCVSPKEVSRIVTLTTSGTTGSPKRVFFTEEDQELTVDFFHRGMTTLTDTSDRVMIFMPGATPGSVGDLLTRGLARFGCKGIVYGPIRDYNDAFRTLAEEKSTAIVGIPSQVLALARMQGADPSGRTGIRNVLLSADYVPETASSYLTRAWGCRVFGHYGMTETGLGGGVECAALDGYHMREADLYYEIVDPETGRSVPDGTFGEVVFTTLTRKGMPLVRTGRAICPVFLRKCVPAARC